MKFNFATAMWVFWYSLLAAISLALFSTIPSLVKYIFSLLVIYIGIRFFRRFETLGMRIIFIVLAILLYFIIVLVITMIIYLRDNPELLNGVG